MQEVIGYRDTGNVGRNGKTVRIAIDSLLARDGEDPLADLLRDLGT